MKTAIVTDAEEWYPEFARALQRNGITPYRLQWERELLYKENEILPDVSTAVLFWRKDAGFFSILTALGRLPAAVMVLTEREQYFEEQQCLAAGASDYQNRDKPFPILLQRLLLLQTKSYQPQGLFKPGKTIRGGSAQVCRLAESGMTPKEQKVFECLLRERGRPVSRQQLLIQVWHDSGQAPRVVDTVIKQLRRKLNGSGIVIRTHYGKGYSIVHNC